MSQSDPMYAVRSTEYDVLLWPIRYLAYKYGTCDGRPLQSCLPDTLVLSSLPLRFHIIAVFALSLFLLPPLASFKRNNATSNSAPVYVVFVLELLQVMAGASECASGTRTNV